MDISTYKAILFDVDKTLTTDWQKIPDRTVAALTLLHDRGIQYGVATGRSYANLKSILSVFPNEALHIVSGGAELIRTDGTVVWKHYIDAATLTQLYAEAKNEHCPIVTAVDGVFYGNEKMRAGGGREEITQSYRAWLDAMKPLEDVAGQDMPIVVVYEPTPAFVQWLENQDHLSGKKMLNAQGVPYIDVTPKGVSKGSAFAKWCTLQGRDSSQVIGVGDSENDRELLQAVGFAVAVGNATEEIKAIADEVIGPCDDEGIATWIETVFQTI